jgi:hypothetical protein
MMGFGKVAALLATIAVAVKAQLDYPTAPTAKWITSTTGGGMFNNNGVYTAPDDSIVVTISQNCIVQANDAMFGNVLWTYLPVGGGYRCFGGVTFNYDAATPYLVFSVVDTPSGVPTS